MEGGTHEEKCLFCYRGQVDSVEAKTKKKVDSEYLDEKGSGGDEFFETEWVRQAQRMAGAVLQRSLFCLSGVMF